MDIQITGEFEDALRQISDGENVLITGKAGTGKSTLLRIFLEQNSDRKILVTAPTGVAALNVDGFTIHRAFGFRPGMYPDDVREGGSWRLSGKNAEVLTSISLLVIDEISMVRADLFDMMDVALRRARKSSLPFGGVQLVLVGDLLQLPPVIVENEAEIFRTKWETPYFFSAGCYARLRLTEIHLTKVWRQSNMEFIDILNSIREGSLTDRAVDVLNSRVSSDFTPPDDWVTLASHRRTVDKINQSRLAQLAGTHFESAAMFRGVDDNYNFGGSALLRYAVGARVMMVINDSAGRFVNGSFGQIVQASDEEISVRIDSNGREVKVARHTWDVKSPTVTAGVLGSESVGSITQFPVVLAWAITIHKSQGKTIPRCFIDLTGGTATDGQFYVALSRAVNLEYLRLSAPIEQRHVRANNSLVRRVRRDVGAELETNRVVFVSFDGVSFGISEHVARVHVIVVEDGARVADFGSWVNPRADLGDFGRLHEIPAGGLAMAPALRDFWPLLQRQAAGGIVVGDRLAMLERAVRHQEKGMPVGLGVGYDISDLGSSPTGSNVVERCESMVRAHRAGKLSLERGTVVPDPPGGNGSVYIPSWAPSSPMQLDPSRATSTDRAWAAISGESGDGVAESELVECIEKLAEWAVGRSYWTKSEREELAGRVPQQVMIKADLPQVVDPDSVDVKDLFQAGTRVAFTGRDNLLGGPADDARLTMICEEKGLVYKSGVSKSRCDVLVALDPASMSTKARKAREFGKPIVSQEAFEDWYVGTGVLEEDESPVVEANTPSPESPTSTSNEEILDELNLVSDVGDVLVDGARIVFKGSTFVDGELYPQGQRLESLCRDLGLEYKQAVTKTRCDVLVTDDLLAEDGKVKQARRFGTPVVMSEGFSSWASAKLSASSSSELVEDPQSLDLDEDPLCTLAEVDEVVASPSTEPDEAHVIDEPEVQESISGTSRSTIAGASKGSSGAGNKSERTYSPENPYRKTGQGAQFSSISASRNPYQSDMTLPNVVMPPSPHAVSKVDGQRVDEARKKFRLAIGASVVLFFGSVPVFGLINEDLAVFMMLASWLAMILVVVFGVQLWKRKKGK